MRERECQAEHHVEGCPCTRCRKPHCGNCRATNRDHFQAKFINRIWRRRAPMQNPDRSENLHPLSRNFCHMAKDDSTPERGYRLAWQLRGGEVKFGQYEYEGYFAEVAEKHGWIFKSGQK